MSYHFKISQNPTLLTSVDFYRYIYFLYDDVEALGDDFGDVTVKGRNFLITSVRQYRDSTATYAQSSISSYGQNLFWDLLFFYFNTYMLLRCASLPPRSGAGAGFTAANFNFITSICLFARKPIKASACLTSFVPNFASRFFHLFCVNVGCDMAVQAPYCTGAMLSSRNFLLYLNHIAAKLPQVFQIKFYMLNRRLRKIMKNSRRYRRIFCYIRPSKRANVLGRYIRSFFKFTKQRTYS
jgi:hypothetical protein